MQVPKTAKATFNWSDPLLLDQQLSEDERMIRDAAAAYAQDKLLPRVVEALPVAGDSLDRGPTGPAVARQVLLVRRR